MRPRKLTMQAFGSYGKKTEIDFTKCKQNLFLITGDTGAGKTTIFDAIVFALYGEASSGSNKKDGMELQSQYASPLEEPYVELTFDEQGVCYTVRRTPRHIRPKKRGTGVIEVSASVSLLMPDGTEYPPKETNQKLEDLIGLTKGQFMQVAMIAQGEFMELLRARSDEKKVIFRKLFQTGFYQKLTEELATRRKEKLGWMSQIRTICQSETAHVAVPETYEEAEETEQLKNRILSSERLLVTDLEALMEQLQKLCTFLEKELKAAEAHCEEAAKKRDADREAVLHARNDLRFFAQQKQAEEELVNCEREKIVREEQQILVRRIRDAVQIKVFWQQWQEANKRLEETKEKLSREKEQFPHAEEKEAQAKMQEEAGEIRYREALEVNTKIVQKAEKALEILKRLEQHQKKLRTDEEMLQKAEKELQKLENEWKILEEEEKQNVVLERQLQDVQMRTVVWQNRQEAEKELESALYKEEQMQKELADFRKQTDEEKKNYEQSRYSYLKKHREYLEAQTAFLDAQAGLLAKEKLREGEPCPVCGSLTHPAPCQWRETKGLLSRKELDQFREEIQNLQMEQEKHAQSAEALRKLTQEKEKSLQELMRENRERMGKYDLDCHDMETDRAKERLLIWKETLQTERTELEKKKQDWENLQQKIADNQKKKEQQKVQETALREKAVAWQAEAAAQKSRMEELQQSAVYQTAQEAEKEKATAAACLGQEKTAYQKIRQQALDAQREKAQIVARISQYEKELPEYRRQEKEKKQNYQNILKETQTTEENWMELAKQYSSQDAERMQNEYAQYKETMAAAKQKLELAQEALKNRDYPDLEKLEQEKAESEKRLLKERELQERLKLQYEANVSVRQTLEIQQKERGKILKEYQKTDHLYQLLSGNVSGARMDIETYVQRYYLEKILDAANRRFREMSAGQFELRMYQLEKAGEGKNRGLDLMVYSTVTGKEREVRTLSGGESFMAALSLALGMADQIQQSCAAIHLDMMFIDEGFGSLDEHSRNQAVQVLKRMAGGSKMIGLISHVTELKQEIETQLLIGKTRQGSEAKWQL